MIVLKMKGRPSYLCTHEIETFNGVHISMGHTHYLKNAMKFLSWNDAVLGTKELFDNDKGLISINDYEPEEI